MKRGKPMRRSPLRRTWTNRSGKKLHTSAEWHRSRQWTFDRANGRCEARFASDCTGRAEHAHHMRMRSQGGSDDPSNLLAVCHICHDAIHRNPATAYGLGLLRKGAA